MPPDLPPICYVSGKISLGSVKLNIQRAVLAGKWLLEHGIAPIVPHISVPFYPKAPLGSTNYARILAVDLALVSVSDAVLRLKGKSFGADLEVRFAKSRNIPVFYSKQKALSYLLSLSQRKAA